MLTTKLKQKQNKSRHIQIDHPFYCSIYPTNNAMVSLKDGFTVWRQSKGTFLVNNILMFGSAWCLVLAQIQFSLIKEIKIWRPEYSLTHPPSYVQQHLIFVLSPTSLNMDVIYVSTLICMKYFCSITAWNRSPGTHKKKYSIN